MAEPRPLTEDRGSTPTRWALRLVALAYLAFLLIIPVGLIFWRTFAHGVGPVWDALTSPDALHAFQVTLIVAGVAVVANTIFGVLASFLLVRHEFRGKAVINKLIDLPLAVSPVVVGLALILVYGRDTSVGSLAERPRGRRHLRPARDDHGHLLRVAAAGRARAGAGAGGDRRGAGAGRGHPGRLARSRSSGGSPCRPSGGVSPTA